MDQECQLFPWNLGAEFCAYKNSLRAVLRLSVIGDLSAVRARADTAYHMKPVLDSTKCQLQYQIILFNNDSTIKTIYHVYSLTVQAYVLISLDRRVADYLN